MRIPEQPGLLDRCQARLRLLDLGFGGGLAKRGLSRADGLVLQVLIAWFPVGFVLGFGGDAMVASGGLDAWVLARRAISVTLTG